MNDIRTLVPDAGISGMYDKLHSTVFCGMQFLVHALDTKPASGTKIRICQSAKNFLYNERKSVGRRELP